MNATTIWLRQLADTLYRRSAYNAFAVREAADEIDRLRAENKVLRIALDSVRCEHCSELRAALARVKDWTGRIDQGALPKPATK